MAKSANKKIIKKKAVADWVSGVHIQLLYFRALPIRQKISIIEEMTALADNLKSRKMFCKV
jgi:hypothetical protein